MSDQILFSDTERKRSNVSSKSLLNLKTIITQNVTSNNNIEKSNEYKLLSFQQNDDFDEIEKKKRKKTQEFPNQNALIEYLTEPNLKKLSIQRIITSKLANLCYKYHLFDFFREQSNIQSPLKRIVIPRTSNHEKEQTKDVILQSDTRVVISENEQNSSQSCKN
jgi:hypothetical protein